MDAYNRVTYTLMGAFFMVRIMYLHVVKIGILSAIEFASYQYFHLAYYFYDPYSSFLSKVWSNHYSTENTSK